jgi:O-antigen/teichoic acid export membrane protein
MFRLRTDRASLRHLTNGRIRLLVTALVELRRQRGRPLPMLLNSVSLILAKVFSLGLGFLAWLVAARLFDATDVGLASAAVAGMMLCVQLALVGVGSSIINLFPRHMQSPTRLLDSAFSIVGIAAVGAGVVFLVFAATLLQQLRLLATDPVFAVVFVLLGLFGAIGVLLDQVSTVLRRGDQALGRNIVVGLVTLLIIAAVALDRAIPSALGILAAWTVGSLAAVVLGWAQLRTVPYRYRPRLEAGLARQLVGLGLPNYVLTLTERAPGPILPIVVTELLSPADNAHWYAVWMVAWVVFIVPIQVGLSLFAEVSHRPEAIAEIVRHGIRSSLAFGIAGAIGLTVGGELVLHFLGPGYASAGAGPLRILVWAVIPMSFIQAYFSTCRATRRLSEAIGVGAASAGAGIAAAAVGGVLAGLTGMALAWLLCQTLTSVVAMWRLRVFARSSESSFAEGPADTVLARNEPVIGVDLRP